MQKKQKPSLHSNWIDRDAFDIVERLQARGHTTYLVGGCVRDLLAGIHPKDFDIATSATPEEIKRQIRNSYPIGRRFRLVLVKRGDQQFEVSTFRRNLRPEDINEDVETPIVGDNMFGSPEQDALRRDFTINALFYDPVKDELIDYAGGIKDIEDGFIRIIGDPDARLKEDPIRILRAIRLAHKLKFTIEPSLREAILKNAKELATSVLPRKREEYLKILRLQNPEQVFAELYDLDILKFVLPTLHGLFENRQMKEHFLDYISLTPSLALDSKDAVQLTLPIAMAYINSLLPQYSKEEKPFWALAADEKLEKFFREEMGLFKAEVFNLTKAIEIQQSFLQVEYFKRKGPRRQQAFLSGAFFELGLQIAQQDHLLSAHQLLYWHSLKNP